MEKINLNFNFFLIIFKVTYEALFFILIELKLILFWLTDLLATRMLGHMYVNFDCINEIPTSNEIYDS